MDSGHATLATAGLVEHTGTRGHEVTGHGSHNDSCGGRTAPVAGPAGEVVRMRARVGDRLVVGEDRIGEAEETVTGGSGAAA